MKKHFLIIVCLAASLFSLPVSAQEQLMTKLFFDNWLRNTTSPLEQQIKQLQTAFSEMEQTVREIRSLVSTEIKIVIGKTEAYIDGEKKSIDVAPVIINDRTMVPVRFIGENFGARFDWDDKTRKVTYTMEGLNIELYIDKKTVAVNSKTETLDAAPIIVNGRTLVPLRFIGQHMGASFEWDPVRQEVTIIR